MVAPNKWPINRYHTLLVLNKDCPDAARQGELYASDLEAAMKFSKDTGQLLIYNTFGAAATQWHQHFQGFSYDSPIRKLKTIPLSADGVVHTIPEYAGGNFVFYGADKVAPAIELINKVRGMPSEYAYTVLFDEDQITVIPRRMEGETPACTQKKIGGFECSMVYVVGTTFSGKVVDKTGEEVFEQLGYEDLFKALQDATVPRDKFDNWYEQHPMYSQKSIPDRYVLQKVVTAGGR